MTPILKYTLIGVAVVAVLSAIYFLFIAESEANASPSTGVGFPLKYGDRGPNVSALQRYLNASNSRYHLTVTGIFDDATEQAVLQEINTSQSDAGIGQVGISYFDVFVNGNY